MATNQMYASGAKQILTRCLGLIKGQSIVILIDETTMDVGTVIADAAQSLGIEHTTLLVPLSIQRCIDKVTDLSTITLEAAKAARAILNCVNANPDCLAFRKVVLESHWSSRTRTGHMPGASLDILELANVNFDQLITNCHNIELALAKGQSVDIFSMTQSGEECCLHADLGGWERIPVASDGIIEDGVWGNVPSGETYIAPIEGCAEGRIVINGSIPTLVIKPGQEIILQFNKGRLEKIEPTDNPTAERLNSSQIQKAIEKNDPDWSNLAEIGIGLNPAVKHLTGNMLFDEKSSKTAHIAIGLNKFMGGTIKSEIHCDMVLRSPTIDVDGKRILHHGEISYEEHDWRENYEEVSIKGSPLEAAEEVARSGTLADTYGKRLQRLLHSEPGRVSACFVGDDETSRLAYVLYKNLSEVSSWMPIHSLAEKVGMDGITTRHVLKVMSDYSLVRFR